MFLVVVEVVMMVNRGISGDRAGWPASCSGSDGSAGSSGIGGSDSSDGSDGSYFILLFWFQSFYCFPLFSFLSFIFLFEGSGSDFGFLLKKISWNRCQSIGRKVQKLLGSQYG